MIKAVRHTGITVTNMEESLRFYRDLLGLRMVLDVVHEGPFIDGIVGHTGTNMRAVMLEAPDRNRIELFQFYSHPKRAPERVEAGDIGCSHVCLCVDDLEQVYRTLSDRGVRLQCPPQVSRDEHAKITYAHDPDGTIIELVQILDPGKDPRADRS
jgi:catechol 2,3-dioxygenase-like lactoylglutathione lyase family enzyme